MASLHIVHGIVQPNGFGPPAFQPSIASETIASAGEYFDVIGIVGLTFRRCYIDGGGVPLYIDNQNANIDNPGANGQPLVVLEDCDNPAAGTLLA